MKKTIVFMAALLTATVMSVKAQDATQTTAKCGQTVKITATPDAGYVFKYWDDDHTNTTATREVTINDQTELYNYVAVFELATCTVTAFTSQTDMGTVTGSGSFAFGATTTIKAEPKSKCYQFVKWSDGDTDAERTITVAATDKDNTYEAIFKEVEFTVSVSNSGSGSVKIELAEE